MNRYVLIFVIVLYQHVFPYHRTHYTLHKKSFNFAAHHKKSEDEFGDLLQITKQKKNSNDELSLTKRRKDIMNSLIQKQTLQLQEEKKRIKNADDHLKEWSDTQAKIKEERSKKSQTHLPTSYLTKWFLAVGDVETSEMMHRRSEAWMHHLQVRINNSPHCISHSSS
jgi:hypothetical protein